MAKKQATTVNNDWQTMIQKPEPMGKKKYEDDKPDPFKQKREDVYYTLYSSPEGEKYAFAMVPAADGTPFYMTDLLTLKRHKFTSPKTGIPYFENLKFFSDPTAMFGKELVDSINTDPTSVDAEKIKAFKRHSDLVQRYKNVQYAKALVKNEKGDDVNLINFGYSKNKKLIFANRLQKQATTAFFGVWTKFKGAMNDKREFGIKLFSTRYGAFQDKFRGLLNQTNDTHQKLQPEWFQDFFSSVGDVKGIIDVEMGSMGPGGKGASIKLVKLGKDAIDDAGVGVTGPITEKDIVMPKGAENELSFRHYIMGFKSTEDIWQDTYMDRVEEAIIQLENHVKEKQLEAVTGSSDEVVQDQATPQSSSDDNEDAPF
jgi:hypothetical protein